MSNALYIGVFHSIHRTTLGAQLYQYYRLVPCGSEPISLNCIYVLSNTRSIPVMILKLVVWQSLVAKCCKIRKI